MRGQVILLVLFITIQFSETQAQEDLVWTNSVEEFRYTGPTDSIPFKKESNFQLEEDTSTNIHFTYFWEPQTSDWINESKSIGIYNQEANCLEMQNYFWDGNDSWTGLIRYFFWYDINGEIPHYRSYSWDPTNSENWTKNDSLAELWEDDGLVKITEEFNWDKESLSWELKEKRRLEKVMNGDGFILEEFESLWDILTGSWVPVSRSLLSYDGGGNLTFKSILFWISDEEDWIEYLRHEFSYDAGLDMWMEERYEWDFLNSKWGLRFIGGVTDEPSQPSSYMIGLKDDSFSRWQIYEKVESEVDDRQLVIKSSTTSKDSEFGEWKNKSQTMNIYNEEKQPLLVIHSNWKSESGTFEANSKKYFFYPGTETSEKYEIADSNYTIFPNPSSSKLHIIGPTAFKAAYIFDLQGKMLQTTDQMEIDVSYLPSGVYLIRILTVDDVTTLLRFIKI